MKKVLVITYYWPPSGGGGVQRWLKFVKYLPEFGWEPVVFTPEVQNAPAVDTGLNKDVSPNLEIIRKPIWEPYALYRKLTGRKKSENLGAAFATGKKSSRFIENLANWIRSNFFIPDARKFWISPSVNFLESYLATHKIDVVVTTGPPHSMHLIGMKLKVKTGVIWLADFRDPWTDIDFYEQLKLTKRSDERHHELEREVLQEADLVICVSNSNKAMLQAKAQSNIEVITNGFDEQDFSEERPELSKKFTIAHIGTFMANRNPAMLWEVLAEEIADNDDFRKDLELQLTGNVDASILQAIETYRLSDYTKLSNQVSHERAIMLQKSAQVLLITVNKSGDSKGMVTGKIFEYLVSGRPILAIGPEDGDLAAILKETQTGVISDFKNKEKLRQNIRTYYRDYQNNRLVAHPQNLQKYSRRTLTKKLAEHLNNLL